MMIENKTFAQILPDLMAGKKIGRHGWGRSDAFLQLTEDYTGELGIYAHYVTLVKKELKRNSWYTASTDMVENDWYVFENTGE